MPPVWMAWPRKSRGVKSNRSHTTRPCLSSGGAETKYRAVVIRAWRELPRAPEPDSLGFAHARGPLGGKDDIRAPFAEVFVASAASKKPGNE
jgi:hypothetical protein